MWSRLPLHSRSFQTSQIVKQKTGVRLNSMSRKRPAVHMLVTMASVIAFPWTACRNSPVPPPQDLVFSLGTNIDFAAGLVKHYGETLRDVRVHVVSSYGAYV